MDMPAAEVNIDAELVARLVRAQHPDLAGPVTPVSNGWDNALYRLGTDHCVRLPRRRIAATLVAHEQRWLPVLAGHVRVRIPVPVRIGVAGDGYPWPWTITSWFQGRTAAELPPAGRTAIAAELADFLADLHRPAPPDAPPNPVRGVPLANRDRVIHERLASGAVGRAGELRALWERLVAVPAWSGPPCWVHGDPHPANLLLAEPPRAGLAAGWLVFDPAGRAAFRTRAGQRTPTDPDTWARARGWAIVMGTAMAVHSDDNPILAAVARHTLEQVLLEA